MGTNPIIKEIDKMINDAFSSNDGNSGQVETDRRVYTSTEDYRKSTGKRFRMSKEELEKFGKTDEGRELAFKARQDSGLL